MQINNYTERKKYLVFWLSTSLIFLTTTQAFGLEQAKKIVYAEKNIVELSGAASFDYTASDALKQVNVLFSPSMNYFIAKKWYLGIGMGVVYGYYRYADPFRQSEWYTGVEPSVSLGFANPLTESLFWFAEGGYFYSTYSFSSSSSDKIEHSLFAKSGLKYDTGNGLVIAGARLRQGGTTSVALLLGFSIYF